MAVCFIFVFTHAASEQPHVLTPWSKCRVVEYLQTSIDVCWRVCSLLINLECVWEGQKPLAPLSLARQSVCHSVKGGNHGSEKNMQYERDVLRFCFVNKGSKLFYHEMLWSRVFIESESLVLGWLRQKQTGNKVLNFSYIFWRYLK